MTTFSGTFSNYTYYLDVSVVSQDPVANTTRISYNFRGHRNVNPVDGAWTELNNVDFAVRINGTSIVSGTPNFDFRAHSDISFLSGQYTLPNAADGSLSFTASATTGGLAGTHFVAGTVSGTVTPIAIKRASDFTLTPNPVLQSTSLVIGITRLNASYTHNITWAGAGSSGSIATGVATTETWSVPGDLLDGASSVTITITVETFLAGVSIGTVSHDLIVRDHYEYPTVGEGTPYDFRFRRTELDGTDWVVKEAIPFTTATFTDSWSATGTCSLGVPTSIYDTSLNFSVVLLEVFDGSSWINTGLLFSLVREEGDLVDITGVITYTGTAYVDFILSKGETTADKTWASNTAGDILSQYITAAHARAWGPLLSFDFTATKTSVNTAWANPEVNLDIDSTQPFSQILTGFVSDAVAEYAVDFHDNKAWLHMYNPGYGRDWTVAGADPVINFKTEGVNKVVSTVPIKKDYTGLLTRVIVSGDSVTATRERADLVNPLYGMLEGSVDATGITAPARLNTLGDDAIISASTPSIERTFSYDLASTETSTALFPYRTFRPGDWVFVPGDSGPAIKQRVSQVAITRDEDGTTATITVGDLIPTGAAALAIKLTQQTSGAIPGGTLGAPDPLITQIPNAPEDLAAVPAGSWDTAGNAVSGVAVSWDEVDTSATGAAVTVDLYEVWTRPELGDPWTLAAQSDDLTTQLGPYPIDTTMDIKVRARNVSGVYGVYSDYVTITTPDPTVLVAAPSDPTLTQDSIGNVSIAWDGLIAATTPPLYFAYIRPEISATGTGGWSPAGQQLTAAGATVVNTGGGTFYFHFVPVDELGRDGTPSNAVSIDVTPVLADTRQPKVPTSFAVTSTGYWNQSEPAASVTATWDAVTEATDSSTMTIISYELWGRMDPNTVSVLLTSSADTTATVENIGPLGSSWYFEVRAFGANAVPSDFSSEVECDIAIPAIALDPPTAPVLDSTRGVLIVSWDGNLYDASTDTAYAAPAYLANVDIWVSTDGGVTYTRQGSLTAGTRSETIAALGVGSTASVTLIAVDRLGQASDPSDAATEVILGIDGADILADTVDANAIVAGSIEVDRVSPSFGDDLDIHANGTVSILVGNDAANAAANSTTADNLAALRTRYDFTSSAAIISQPGSAFAVSISNTELDFMESGIARAYLNAGVFYAPKLSSTELTFTAHLIEDDPAGTVVKRF